MNSEEHGQADPKVFEWLNSESGQGAYYLSALNLVWGERGVERGIEVFQHLAGRLSLEPSCWSAVIRDVNWRFTLVGCFCCLVSANRDHLEDMRYRFEEGSWVAPQIAVAMAILHPDEARKTFLRALETPGLRKSTKRSASAERALICLGASPASTLDTSALSPLELSEAQIANAVVQKHWEFWSGRGR